MKAKLAIKWLFYLNNQKSEQGFTIIELLVVIIIIGILSAIALPSFMSCGAKSRASEAKQILGTTMRAQQAYYLENSVFASNVGVLAIGIKVESPNFKYGTGSAVSIPEVNLGKFYSNDNYKTNVFFYSAPVDPKVVRGYAVAAYATLDKNNNTTTISLICESNKPGGLAEPQGFAPARISDSLPCSKGKALK